MMTQLDGFKLNWPLGPDQLSIVSIGTGTSRTKLSFKELGLFGPLRVTLSALLSLMSDIENSVAHPDAVARRMPAAVGDQLRDPQSRRRRAARRQVVPVPALRRAARSDLAQGAHAARFHRAARSSVSAGWTTRASSRTSTRSRGLPPNSRSSASTSSPTRPERRRRPDSRWTRPRRRPVTGRDFCPRRRPDLCHASIIGAFCPPA